MHYSSLLIIPLVSTGVAKFPLFLGHEHADTLRDGHTRLHEAQGQDTTVARAAEIERARAMKANLTKTTFVLGDDPEYM
jgi:hypothetical protein